eukprot:GHRR01017462.1.p2 GENE.GHRR01017462.1~~GHRR01017462.1.p2  ORF type:complete len:228 (+),score=50.60 GHRR01017462.1:376-1059(+)
MGDSTGKGKFPSTMRDRNQVIAALFVVGMCAGIIMSERTYISYNREDILRGTALVNKPQQQPAQLRLNQAVAPAAPSQASYIKDAQMIQLEAYLQKVAPTREALVGVSNVNPLREGMLDTFLHGVKQAGVTNYVIVALDHDTETDLKARDINVFYMPIGISKSQADTGANHAVSALKFGIINKFLLLGWAVLLSDIDVCVLQDPFKFLYRYAGVGCEVSWTLLYLPI